MPINIVGVQVCTWWRWVLVMLLFVTVESVNTWSYKHYKNWYRYEVLCKGQPVRRSVSRSLLLITVWRLVTFVPSTFKWLAVVSTMQLQFLLPALIVRTSVSNYIDVQTMRAAQ